MTTMSINKHKYLTTIMLCHTVLWMMLGDIRECGAERHHVWRRGGGSEAVAGYQVPCESMTRLMMILMRMIMTMILMMMH